MKELLPFQPQFQQINFPVNKRMLPSFIQSLERGKRARAHARLGTRPLLAASTLPSCRRARGSTTPRGLWAPTVERSSRNSLRCGGSCCSSSSVFGQLRLCSGRSLVRWIGRRRMQQLRLCTLASLRKVSLPAFRDRKQSQIKTNAIF